jgi:Xaa-Pro aminopeptidase
MSISAGKIVARQHGAMEYSEAPVDLDVVRRYRLERIQQQLRRLDYAGILLFDQINTRYACDATNLQVWCSHYETRCVFIATDGPLILFDYGEYPHLAEGIPTID